MAKVSYTIEPRPVGKYAALFCGKVLLVGRHEKAIKAIDDHAKQNGITGWCNESGDLWMSGE